MLTHINQYLSYNLFLISMWSIRIHRKWCRILNQRLFIIYLLYFNCLRQTSANIKVFQKHPLNSKLTTIVHLDICHCQTPNTATTTTHHLHAIIGRLRLVRIRFEHSVRSFSAHALLHITIIRIPRNYKPIVSRPRIG